MPALKSYGVWGHSKEVISLIENKLKNVYEPGVLHWLGHGPITFSIADGLSCVVEITNDKND